MDARRLDAIDGPDAAGKLAFESKCLACHSIGGGKKLGPDLAGDADAASADAVELDLAQAEAIADMIDAGSRAAVRAAMRSRVASW